VQRYLFTITLSGIGDNPDKAWQDATEQFSLDPGPTPGEDEYTVEPFDEDG